MALQLSGSGSINVTGGPAVTISPLGHLSTPSRIAFFAGGTSSSNTIATGANYYPVFGTVKYNIGGYYNSGTGYFTAPVAGLYLFRFRICLLTATINGMSGGPDFYMDVYVNGSRYIASGSGDTYGGQPVGYYAGTERIILANLAANDSCRPGFFQNTGGTVTIREDMSAWWGTLLG